MKFAIRDDDTSYFTKPEELERAYDFIEHGTVSLSVIPYGVYSHKGTVYPYGEEKGCEGFFDIAENCELVDYLAKKCSEGRYDVLLHGYNHEYRQIKGKWFAEMMWKDRDRLYRELSDGKAHLERLLDRSVSVFVAPNNHMGAKGIYAIERLGMDFSGIIGFFDRRLTPRYLLNLVNRWGYRAFKGIQSPKVYNYGGHRELCAYALDSIDRLKREYHECKRLGYPFVVYTHYWNVNASKEQKDMLREIYSYVTQDGAELVPLSDCFK